MWLNLPIWIIATFDYIMHMQPKACCCPALPMWGARVSPEAARCAPAGACCLLSDLIQKMKSNFGGGVARIRNFHK